MNDIQKRFLLFLLMCIPLRLLMVHLAKTQVKYSMHMGYIAIAIGVSMLFIYLTGIRKTGPETMGKEIWWNNYRPFHATMFLLFAYFTIRLKNAESWKFLLIDAIAGLVFFLKYHFEQGNFQSLLKEK